MQIEVTYICNPVPEVQLKRFPRLQSLPLTHRPISTSLSPFYSHNQIDTAVGCKSIESYIDILSYLILTVFCGLMVECFVIFMEDPGSIASLRQARVTKTGTICFHVLHSAQKDRVLSASDHLLWC